MPQHTNIAYEDRSLSTYHLVVCLLACTCRHVIGIVIPNPSEWAMKNNLSRAWRRCRRTMPASAHLPESTIRLSVKKKPFGMHSSATKCCNYLQVVGGSPISNSTP